MRDEGAAGTGSATGTGSTGGEGTTGADSAIGVDSARDEGATVVGSSVGGGAASVGAISSATAFICATTPGRTNVSPTLRAPKGMDVSLSRRK